MKDDTPHLQPLYSLRVWLPGKYTGTQVEPTGKGTRLLFLLSFSQRLPKKHVLIICSDSKAARLILKIFFLNKQHKVNRILGLSNAETEKSESGNTSSTKHLFSLQDSGNHINHRPGKVLLA